MLLFLEKKTEKECLTKNFSGSRLINMVLVPPAVINTSCSYPMTTILSLLKLGLSWQEHVFHVAFTISTYPGLTTAQQH